MPRRVLVRLLHRLDRSPLPMLDAVRLELEAELLAMLAAQKEPARAVRREPEGRPKGGALAQECLGLDESVSFNGAAPPCPRHRFSQR